MGAAEVGIVEDYDVARLPVVEDGERGGDAVRHRAQVRGDVGGLGHQAARAVKKRAREVEALLDVGRVACALQCDSHLLGDAAETVAVELEGDGIGSHGLQWSVASGQWLDAGNQA